MGDLEPDFTRSKKVLLLEGESDYVPFYELLTDVEIIQVVTNKPLTIDSYI